jgi:hypothetical protein
MFVSTTFRLSCEALRKSLSSIRLELLVTFLSREKVTDDRIESSPASLVAIENNRDGTR